MKAVVTVTGKDNVGIIAKVSVACAEKGANILDIAQSVLGDYFAMIMLVDVNHLDIPFVDFVDVLTALGNQHNLRIDTMHEDIFNSMHRI